MSTIINIQATNAYIIKQSSSGNEPVSSEFYSGYYTSTQLMAATIMEFETPEELIGHKIINIRPYAFLNSEGWNTDLLGRGEYAPIANKAWSDLDMPPSYDDVHSGYEPDENERWGWIGYLNSWEPGWCTGSLYTPSHWQYLKSDIFKSALNGLVFYGPNYLIESSNGEPFNHFSFTQKPYFQVEMEPVEMSVVNGFPNGGYIDKNQNLQITWDYTQSNAELDQIFDRLPQVTSAYVILTNTSTNETKQYSVEAPYTSVTIPANDISDGNYQWEVHPTFDCEGYVTEDRHYTFTTLSEIPVAIVSSPADEIVNGDGPIIFSWIYLSGSNSQQAKWEIEVSGNGTQWVELYSGEGSAVSYAAPANSMPTGRQYWRVRVTDTLGNISEWSDPAQIIVQAQVGTPSITLVTNQARPVVQWQSSGQISYELNIYKDGALVYTTGETPGSATAHQVTTYLSPGSYTAKVRIRDSALELSDWGVGTFTLAFSTSLTPSLTAQSVSGGVQLTPSGIGVTNYLLRDGVPIARWIGAIITPLNWNMIDQSTSTWAENDAAGRTWAEIDAITIREDLDVTYWTDFAASAGPHVYVLRAVDEADNFTDSAPVTATTTIRRGALLAPVSDLSQMLELWLRRGENPTRSMTSQATTTTHHAAGREYPIVDYYEFSNNELSLAFSFRDVANWEALRALLGHRETMLYRDNHGGKCYIVVPSSGWERGRFSVDFDLNALQVDYVEAISYDPPGGTK